MLYCSIDLVLGDRMWFTNQFKPLEVKKYAYEIEAILICHPVWSRRSVLQGTEKQEQKMHMNSNYSTDQRKMHTEDHFWRTNDDGAWVGAWGADVGDGVTWAAGVELKTGWATGGFWAGCNEREPEPVNIN